MRRDSYLCCGVRIDGMGPQTAVSRLLESRYGIARGAHLCNSYTLALALRDPAYRQELNAGHLNFADGHYVAMVGRWRGQRDLTERVYGPDLMLAAMDRGRERGLRHYLYGATPDTVNRLAEALRKRFPGVEIVGIESPPFRKLREDEEAQFLARVAQARPDILWVGIGTPRQDSFVARYTESLRCTVVPVGAAFDFHSGNKPAAPRLIKRMGFEWLFRFAMEPRRLWRRYLIGIPVFIFGVITDLARRMPPRPAPAPARTAAPTAAPTPVPTSATAMNGNGSVAPSQRTESSDQHADAPLPGAAILDPAIPDAALPDATLPDATVLAPGTWVAPDPPTQRNGANHGTNHGAGNGTNHGASNGAGKGTTHGSPAAVPAGEPGVTGHVAR